MPVSKNSVHIVPLLYAYRFRMQTLIWAFGAGVCGL